MGFVHLSNPRKLTSTFSQQPNKGRPNAQSNASTYLVEEDLAAGECDVEKKVGVSEGLTFEQSSQPIRHIRSRKIGNGGYVIMYEEDKTLYGSELLFGGE